MNLWTDEVGTFLEVIDGEGCSTFADVKYLDTKVNYCIVEIGEGQACKKDSSYYERGDYYIDLPSCKIMALATQEQIEYLVDKIRHQR